MAKFIDIVGPAYRDLVEKCEKRKIAINLDFQSLTVKINSDEDVAALEKFLKAEITRALKNCKAGDKITLSEVENDEYIRISIKNSGAETLTADEKEKLIAAGYEVRARFGYDTIVTLKLKK